MNKLGYNCIFLETKNVINLKKILFRLVNVHMQYFLRGGLRRMQYSTKKYNIKENQEKMERWRF